MVENINKTHPLTQDYENTDQFNPYYIFKTTSEKYPNNISITYKNSKYTTQEILEQINNFTNHIISKTKQTTHETNTILYSAKNHPLLLVAYLSTAKIKATFIPINPKLSEKEKEHIIKETNPIIHITNENLLDYYEQCFISLTDDKTINTRIETLLTNNIHDTNVILYTSGSSGKPKGVKLSYENLWWGSKNLREGFQYNYSDKMLVLAPMSHIGGFNGCTIDILINGGSITIADSLEATHILKIIENQKITITFAVPTLYEKILSEHSTENIQTLRLPLTGGSPVPKTLLQKAQKHGLKLLPVWGMTEISASGTYLPQHLINTKPNNIGIPFPYVEIQILDLQTLQPITVNGKLGEIAVKGKNVTNGYVGYDIKDEEHFCDDLLLTKDLGCWYENKYIQITGRKTDLIISGGEHVFPNEIDEILQTHPFISASKTFAIKDTYWGEKIISAVTLKPENYIKNKDTFEDTNNNTYTNKHKSDTTKEYVIKDQNVTYQNIKNFLSTLLTHYKIPKEILVITKMPLSPNGKIDTQKLEKKYLDITQINSHKD